MFKIKLIANENKICLTQLKYLILVHSILNIKYIRMFIFINLKICIIIVLH